jgi:hypothetical protein
MSRQVSVPSYRQHKQSGQAIVTLTDGMGNRRDVLLGKYGSAQSRAEYAHVIAEWEAAGRRLPAKATGKPADLTVNELLLAYSRWAKPYYVKDGKRKRSRAEPSSRVGCWDRIAVWCPSA